MLNDSFAEDMVVISSVPKLFLGELAQVAFGAPCAFGLKFPFEAEDAAFLLDPSSISKASDGWK